jgi:hypothetical protein
MAKEPANRFSSADDLRLALEALLVAPDVDGANDPTKPLRPHPQAPRRRFPRTLVAAVAVVAVLAVGLVVWQSRPGLTDGSGTPGKLENPGEPVTHQTGWVSLFDGRTLDGWERLKPPGGSWNVENGWLVGRGPNGYLYTKHADYQDFRLRVTGRIPGKQNSGVFVRASPGDSLPHGYEVQLGWDSNEPSFGKVYGNLSSGLYRESHSIQRAVLVNPNEEFTLEIEVKGREIHTRVNGKEGVHFHTPANGLQTGRIGLQAMNEGKSAEFREIAIQELSP